MKKPRTVKSGIVPEESDNNNDSEKVEEINKEGEVAEENGDKPKLLEDEVKKERRKSPATEEKASKDGGDHV